MKIIVNNCEYIDIIKEALEETTSEWGEGGIVVEAVKTDEDKTLKIKSDGKTATIWYSSKPALLRGIAIILSYENEPFEKEEKLQFNHLGNMVDCSRNAVIKPETFKKLIRISALCGHTSFMLYTEETYEIPSEPYFGHMRGRYTQEEMREMDAYAERFGIELMPCIQTLAHLGSLFAFPAMQKYRDLDDILNVAKEETYELIDRMLESVSSSIKSRKINVGLDEAHLLGRGKYLDRAGYSERSDIMYRHLNRVVELCRKYGYEPMIWDDMFFRVNAPNGGYYSGHVTEKEAAMVPADVNLCYWDYSWVDKKNYSEMLEKHKVFKNNKISFAGGAFTWYGCVPQTAFSMNASRAALTAIFENTLEIDTVLITEWGDDGGFNSILTALPTMILYGEGSWAKDLTNETVAKRIKIFGEELEDFYTMDDINFAPIVEDVRGTDPLTPHNYMLYQDVLQGLWDWHVPEGISEHFASVTKKLHKIVERNTPYSHIYHSLEKLSSLLEIKAELGLKIKKAYDNGDKDALRHYANDVIPELIKRVKEYIKVYRYQWKYVNKDFGLEVFDARIGGMLCRLDSVIETLTEYTDGDRVSIPELEQERLPYQTYCKEKSRPISCFFHYETFTSSRVKG